MTSFNVLRLFCTYDSLLWMQTNFWVVLSAILLCSCSQFSMLLSFRLALGRGLDLADALSLSKTMCALRETVSIHAYLVNLVAR